MSAANKQIVESVNKAFDENNVEAFLSYCTEDVIWNMVGDNTPKGKDAIRKFMKDMPQEAPEFSVKDMIAEADMAMCRGDVTMKNKEGKPEDYAFCDVYRFWDGKIAELTSYVIKHKK